MRLIAPAWFLATLTSLAASAQTPDDVDFNFGCIERITIPEYPTLAKQARIQGTITATISLPSRVTSPRVETVYPATAILDLKIHRVGHQRWLAVHPRLPL